MNSLATGASGERSATTSSKQTNETKSPPPPPSSAPEKHALLRRHFSSIGIGDCFVIPPSHPLPSSYLATSGSAQSENSAVLDFVSTELVGAIKSTPQDFVVREIGLPDGRIIPGLSPEQVESLMRMASLEEEEDGSVTTRNNHDKKDPVVTKKHAVDTAGSVDEKKVGTKTTQPPAPDELTMADDTVVEQPPVAYSKVYDTMQQDQNDNVEPLQAAQSDIPTSTDTTAASLPPDPMASLQSFLSTSSTTMDDLVKLQASTVEWIQRQRRANSSSSTIQCNNSNKGDSNQTYSTSSVSIHPLLGKDSTREERGLFYKALKLAFPLLKVQSTETKSSPCADDCSGSNENNDFASYYQIQVTVDDSFFGLIPYLYEPHVDIPRLHKFLRAGYDIEEHDQQLRSQHGRQRRQSNNVNIHTDNRLYLRLLPDLDRSKRRPIHQIIDTRSGRSLSTETRPSYPLHPEQKDCTQTTAAIGVSWSKTAQRRACKNKKKRKREQTSNDNNDAPNTEEDPYPNALFVLKKTQKEHLAAIQLLSQALHCRQPDIGLSGIKDMQAVTYQFCTVRNFARRPDLVRQARAFLKSRGLEISKNIYKVSWFLQKGTLEGNRFEIVLRNVRRIQVSKRTATSTATESFVPCDTEYIQEAVKRIERHGMLNFYGEQRVGAAGDTELVGTRALDIGRAMLQQDYSKAIDLLMTGRLVLGNGGAQSERDEVKLARKTWKESGGDPFATWKMMPRNESVMLRERIVLGGLKRYGKSNPLEALKCLQYNERVFWIQAYQSYCFNQAVTERVQRYGYSQVVPGDLVRSRQNGVNSIDDACSECPVVVLTKEMLEDYSIEDVLLPLPGYNIIYPTNAVGTLYQSILKADNIVFRKDAPPEATAKGSYRSLKASVKNVKSEILSRSDSSLDLRLWFDLPAGSYATMLLRELLRTTVSRELI